MEKMLKYNGLFRFVLIVKKIKNCMEKCISGFIKWIYIGIYFWKVVWYNRKDFGVWIYVVLDFVFFFIIIRVLINFW